MIFEFSINKLTKTDNFIFFGSLVPELSKEKKLCLQCDESLISETSLILGLYPWVISHGVTWLSLQMNS